LFEESRNRLASTENVLNPKSAEVDDREKSASGCCLTGSLEKLATLEAAMRLRKERCLRPVRGVDSGDPLASSVRSNSAIMTTCLGGNFRS
jgi:hypothetical protein